MMKKVMLLVIALLAVQFTFAQDANTVLDTFLKNTGIEQFAASRDGRSSMVSIEMSMGPMVMPIKATAKYPSMFRVEMDIQGNHIVTILRDTTAYITAGGKSQVVTDQEQIKQFAPVTDIIGEIIPSREKSVFTYVGQEGKGKNAVYVLDVVSKKDSKNTSRCYFNVETGMLDRVVAEEEHEGKQIKIETTYKKYTPFGEGELTLPTLISSKTPMGVMLVEIKDMQLDFPIAPWMFAIPKN